VRHGNTASATSNNLEIWRPNACSRQWSASFITQSAATFKKNQFPAAPLFTLFLQMFDTPMTFLALPCAKLGA
jgi:hypothetical protein